MIGKRKLTALVSSLMAGVIFMSACSVNMNGIGEAFTDLGENLNQAAHDNNEEAACRFQYSTEKTWMAKLCPKAAFRHGRL